MRSVVVALAFALSVGCSSPAPEAVELQVGARRISVVIPEGWEHLDYGDRHHLRRGLARISIEEVGGWSGSALVRLGETQQRDVASRNRVQVGAHEAEIVDTWDRLSHQHRKRFFFLKDDGPLVAIYTMSGVFEPLEPDFDALVASVAFVDSVGTIVRDDVETQLE